MMVEVPAAVMMIDHFVEEVDFLSIGTNDLVQYTMAADRSNKDVVALYNVADPAVLKLVAMAIEAADRKPVPINLCGQMSSSVAPAAIPEIKKVCRSVTVEQCKKVAQRALTMETARNVVSYLREELKKNVPELGQ
jgi:phosphotransferase system enzyme I (PtsI)